ncbi:protein FRIGIDA isoform X2 [Brachypodium distachyon]|uniref:FRIGIDA-like protein n=1 Tax=Brachypodium distachyon TaxID=15368 RepID=A0A0Q3J2C8_BRADI|nr:protein FRIGIDA isoform X2 [Brachypodium distachyon]KQK12083.1 hypothetical protein BRADI_1g01520v3 [Brachypodium distachyon]|eukprot:XP_003559137.2 protein FRIGIDA isoform X2 [Brachypodium distachyon]
MAPTAPPPPASSLQAILSSVEGLTSFSNQLADFLDQWNSLLLDANAVLAALPSLPEPAAEPVPKPIPVFELGPISVAEPADLLRQLKSALADSTPSPAAAAAVPVADLVPQSNPKPEREHIGVPEPQGLLDKRSSVIVDATSIPAAAKPVPAAAAKPVLEPVLLSAEVETKRKPEPQPKPAPDRERKAGGSPAEAVLGKICEGMGSRALRRFATAHMRDRDRSWLRRVAPAALLRAPDPAALVLRAVGRYYICTESENAEAACLLLLELYVRAGCPRRQEHWRGEAALRAEARETALSWRSRIVREKGRVADASTRDAHGLILFMAAFGVPVEFPVQELYELLFAGGGLACAEVLKCSLLFARKMREVVADRLNKGSYQEAIGVILAFELQDAFPLAGIMSYVVEKVVHNRKDQEGEGQPNLAGTKEHDEEELVLLRSISKYVEEHTPCSSDVLCLSIAERIKLLEERVGKPMQAVKAMKRI